MIADFPRSRGVSLRFTVEGSARAKNSKPFVVLGHDLRLAQVITNLVDNACSFSQPGGEVRIRLSRENAEASGEADGAGDRVVIAVEDEGPGIPAHALERIFERFYTDRPDDGFGQNSGLGLSISRQIVEAHSGQIWAENCARARRAGGPGQGRRRDPSGGAPRANRRRRSLCRQSSRRVRMKSPTLEPVSCSDSLHACALVVGERGMLIRGPSGAGKSTLSLAILSRARASGLFAALVADDRVFLSLASSHLIARGARVSRA